MHSRLPLTGRVGVGGQQREQAALAAAADVHLGRCSGVLGADQLAVLR